MDICIRRGSRQIGGSCVEIRQDEYRILIDFGLPLDAEGCDKKYLPEVPGLDGKDASLLGILISHPHLDHFGLLSLVAPNIPVGMGPAARRILTASASFLPDKFSVSSSGWNYDSGRPIEIGPFRVTPLLADHSAYDAYSLLIEAAGKRLFYSGDIRAHGRKGSLFHRTLSKLPENIDALLLEGSSLGRVGNNDTFPSENQIESDLIDIFNSTEGLALVHCSAQNIDRIISIFRACRQTGRKLVVDLYTAAILEATGNRNIPQSDWPDVALVVPQCQRIHVKKHSLFNLLEKHSRHRMYLEHLKEAPQRATILFRPLYIPDLEKHSGLLHNAVYIYSQWEGYWKEGKFENVETFLSKNNIRKQSIHTSGHASPADLHRFVERMKPSKVVPIHSFLPERYSELFPNVELHGDNEWWKV